MPLNSRQLDALFTEFATYRRQQAQENAGEKAEGEPAEEEKPNEEAKPSESAEDASGTAFDRKQFISAWHLDAARYPLLSGIDAPAAAAGIAWFTKSGDPGTSRLREWATNPMISFTHGENIFALALGLISLDAGTPRPEAEIGGPGPQITAPTTRLRLGVEPEFNWSRKGEISPFLAIGSTPFNGIIGPTVEGRLGAAVHFDETKVTPEIYRKSIAESILSYTGIVDPSTGLGFGRVVESGGKLEIDQPITKRWSLNTSGSAAIVRGVSVADNAHFSVQLTPSYDLQLAHFDSFTIGPTYQYESFNRNLSEFTLGQGGYYSPQASHTIGISFDFQSEEGRDLIFHGNLSPGWEINRQASSPVFPLNDNGERFPAFRQSGSSVTGEFALAYRMTPRLLLGGLVRFQQSPQYNDFLIGLSLKLSFAPRAALFSSDLPNATGLMGPTER